MAAWSTTAAPAFSLRSSLLRKVSVGVHLASSPPVRCAACYEAAPERRFVDFGAATDGPVFLDESGAVLVAEGGQTVQVEEIVICENCCATATEVLDLSPEARTGLELQIEAERKIAESWRQRAESLQATLGEWTDTRKVVEVIEQVEIPERVEKSREAVGGDLRGVVLAQVEAKEITAAEAARRLGVTPQTIYNWRRREKERVA